MAASSPERMKRHSRKARHLLRVIRRSKHAAVQDMAVHELTHEIDRRHGWRGAPASHAPGPAGEWRPLTHQAKNLISQLRKTKVWRLQKQLVRELAAELRNGRRIVDRMRELAARAARAARAKARRLQGRWRARRNLRTGRPRIPAARRPVLRGRPVMPAAVRPTRARTRTPRVRTARPRTRTR